MNNSASLLLLLGSCCSGFGFGSGTDAGINRTMDKDEGAEDLKTLGWQLVTDDATALPAPSGESMFFGVEEVDGDELNAFLGAKRPAEVTETPKEPQAKRKKRKRPTKKERERRSRKRKLAAEDNESEAAAKEEVHGAEGEEEEEDIAADLPDAWSNLGVGFHTTIVRGLLAAGFDNPTPIQAAVLPRAMLFRQDVVGAAPTGSGKTLAFGIPLVHFLLEAKQSRSSWFDTESPKALVLAPTRELAMQVTQHLRAIAGEDSSKSKVGALRITPIVGGMAEQKQQRLLRMHPEVIVATPGRFWEMVKNARESDTPFLSRLGRLRFLVIDEADRMVETGRYRELKALLQYVHEEEAFESLPASERRDLKKRKRDQAKEWIIHDTGTVDLADTPERTDEDPESGETYAPKPTRQTFIFSATLKSLGEAQRSSKKSDLEVGHILNLVLPSTSADKASSVTKKRERRKSKVFQIDLTSGGKPSGDEPSESVVGPTDEKPAESGKGALLPKGLSLNHMKCLQQQKDAHLYYFLSKFKGKILVFVSAVKQAKRLATLLSLLKIPVRSLHAQMQQRQRLRALDVFKAEPNCVLVATDVAARGLDVANIRVVFHYDIPNNVQTFVHRAGRTARATRHGLSVSLVAPMDDLRHEKIVRALREELPADGTCDASDAPRSPFQDFPVDDRKMKKAKERVGLARKMTTAHLNEERVSSENGWLRQQAREADLDFDEDLLDQIEGSGDMRTRSRKKASARETGEQRLAEMLEEPLFE